VNTEVVVATTIREEIVLSVVKETTEATTKEEGLITIKVVSEATTRTNIKTDKASNSTKTNHSSRCSLFSTNNLRSSLSNRRLLSSLLNPRLSFLSLISLN
jgi:hypothetical protein